MQSKHYDQADETYKILTLYCLAFLALGICKDVGWSSIYLKHVLVLIEIQ